jgi:hypothetical protein
VRPPKRRSASACCARRRPHAERARQADRERREEERRRAEAEKAAERERVMREAAAAAERALEQQRQQMEEERRQLEAAQAAERARLLREAEAAAARAIEAERQRQEEEQRARAALEAAEQERQLRAKEEAAAAERKARRQKPQPKALPKPKSVPGPAFVRADTVMVKPARTSASPAPRKPAVVSNDPFAEIRAVVVGTNPDSVFQKMPITAWARPSRPAEGAKPEQDDAVALLTRFRLPVDVAGFAYPSGCRIRRVRVPALDEHLHAASGPVIVSKRTLEDLRTPR